MAQVEKHGFEHDSPYVEAIMGKFRWLNDDGTVNPVELGVRFSSPFFDLIYNVGTGEYEPIPVAPQFRWTQQEINRVWLLLNSFEAVANIDFVDGDNVTFGKRGGLRDDALGLSGSPHWYHNVIDDHVDTLFDVTVSSWNLNGLTPGGRSAQVILHEVGHAVGLHHPHDDGIAGAGSELWPGVEGGEGFDSGSPYNNNNSAASVMSYIAGPPTDSENWGWVKGPMAVDIAALQMMYGANLDHNTGDDVYTLPVNNQVGTGWLCIWDADGDQDTILTPNTNRSAFIDLAAATLTGRQPGGPFSFVQGIYGGFSIANGVVIENASGSRGHDTIKGNQAGNTLSGGFGFDTLYGMDGDDYLYGNQHNDTLYGGAESDHLYGGAGEDTYFGEEGDDFIYIDAQDMAGGRSLLVPSWLNGGGDYDTLRFEGRGTLSIEMAGSYIEQVDGTSGDDVISGIGVTYGGLVINGNGGHDTLTGSGLDDELHGDAGRDRFHASAGTDEVWGGDDVDIFILPDDEGERFVNLITGRAWGDGLGLTRLDSIEHVQGGRGVDHIWGGFGENILYGGAGDDIIIESAGFNALHGHGGNDRITGGIDTDLVYGGDDNDTLAGGDGRDFLYGEAGNDVLDGGIGGDDDTISGGADNDTVTYLSSRSRVEVDLQAGRATGDDAGTDTLSQIENVVGSRYDDTLKGDTRNNMIFGHEGADRIEGGRGNDRLWGGTEGDFFQEEPDWTLPGLGGGDPFDALNPDGTGPDVRPGTPRDILLKGSMDVFVFGNSWGRDVIYDFQDGIDKIDFSTHTRIRSFSQLEIGYGRLDPVDDAATIEQIYPGSGTHGASSIYGISIPLPPGTSFDGGSLLGAHTELSYATISFGRDSIMIVGASPADIDAADFLFR